jgi:hypothetical protein
MPGISKRSSRGGEHDQRFLLALDRQVGSQEIGLARRASSRRDEQHASAVGACWGRALGNGCSTGSDRPATRRQVGSAALPSDVR